MNPAQAIAFIAKYGRKALPAAEEQIPGLVRRAPAIEGEVVGDLIPKVERRILPDIEASLAQRAAPLMLQGIESAAPIVDNAASGIADDVISKARGLTGKQQLAGLAGLGAAAYGGSKLMGGGEEPPKDTTNFVDPNPDSETEVDSDENDTILNPIKKPEGKSASEYLALSKSQPQEQSQDVPEVEQDRAPAEDPFEKKLQDAQESDRSKSLLMGLLKASQMGGSALAGSKADTSFADTELAKPNQNVNRLKTETDLREENKNIQDKNQKRDPESRISKIYQNMLQQLKPDMKVAGLSAMDVEKVFPQIGTIVAKQESVEAKKAQQELLLEEKKNKSEQKEKDATSKELTDYDKHLTNQSKGRMGIVQNALMKFAQAQNINQMFETLPKNTDGSINFNATNRPQKEELIRGVDTLLSSGKATVSGSAELRKAYSTMYDKLADIRQHLSTDSLPDLGQQKIIHQMYDLLQREAQTARYQAAKGLYSSASTGFTRVSEDAKMQAVADRTELTPEEVKVLGKHNIKVDEMMALKQKGLEPADILSQLESGKKIKDILGAKSTTIGKGKDSEQQDPQVTAYAKQYNLDYAHAKAIIDHRKANKGI